MKAVTILAVIVLTGLDVYSDFMIFGDDLASFVRKLLMAAIITGVVLLYICGRKNANRLYRIRATSSTTNSSSVSHETYTLEEARSLLVDLKSEPMNRVLIFTIEEA